MKFVIIFASVLMVFSFSACDIEKKDEPTKFEGVWFYAHQDLHFSGSKVELERYGHNRLKGTFSFTKTTITFNFTQELLGVDGWVKTKEIFTCNYTFLYENDTLYLILSEDDRNDNINGRWYFVEEP